MSLLVDVLFPDPRSSSWLGHSKSALLSIYRPATIDDPLQGGLIWSLLVFSSLWYCSLRLPVSRLCYQLRKWLLCEWQHSGASHHIDPSFYCITLAAFNNSKTDNRNKIIWLGDSYLCTFIQIVIPASIIGCKSSSMSPLCGSVSVQSRNRPPMPPSDLPLRRDGKCNAAKKGRLWRPRWRGKDRGWKIRWLVWWIRISFVPFVGRIANWNGIT